MFREAHKPTYTINCISMLEGGRNFISNSNDNTIKLWDLRNPSRFVEV
jgi:WD40 repeat protein